MGLGQDGGSDSGEVGEKSDTGSDLMVAQRGYAEGLDVACERKENQNTITVV